MKVNPMSHYMFVTTPGSFEKLYQRGDNRWLLSSRSTLRLRELEVGEEVLLYITQKSGVIGKLRVNGQIRTLQRSAMLAGNYYECELPVEFAAVVKTENVVKIRDYVNELQLTKANPSNWGASFQRSIVKLTKSDFEFLKSKLDEAYKIQQQEQV